MSDLTTPPNPTVKKSRFGIIVLISLFALGIVGVGGWFGARALATQKAKEELAASVVGTPYEGQISYDSLSATPFGDFEMTNLRIGDPNGDPAYLMTVGQVKGHSSEKGDGLSSDFDVTMTDMIAPIPAAARLNNQPLSLYQDLMDLGYNRISGDIAATWSYDHQSGDLAMVIGVDYDDMMTLTLGLKLAGVDLSSLKEINEIKALPQSQQQAAFLTVGQRVMAENTSAKLVDLRIDTNIRPFVERYGKQDSYFSPETMAADVDPGLFVLAGQSPQEAEKSAAAVKAMLLEGKMVHLQTNIKEPLLLLSIVQPQGAEAFVQALNLTVTN